MTKDLKQQFTFRIAQANSTEMIVILYEMLLSYLDEAQDALQSGDGDLLREAVNRSRNCLNELLQSLHMEYAPAPELRRLYFYCIRELVHVQIKLDEEALEHIRRVIVPLHDAYGQIAGQNTSGPVMGNSQTVYAGLTYGRNTLTENMADQGADRGMRV